MATEPITCERLADILRAAHRSVILEADEWRPLAQHVLDAVRLGALGTPRDQAYALIEETLRYIQWGNPGYEDNCPVCARPEERGHLGWCQVGKALQAADAARREVSGEKPEGETA